MYEFYKELTRIKSLYPYGAKIQYHSSSSNDVLVMKITGKGKPLAIYLNVGRTSGDYLMNPEDVLGTSYTNISAINAPSAAGGDIGHAAYGLSVFQGN